MMDLSGENSSSRIVAIIIAILLIAGGWYYFYYMDTAQKIANLERSVKTLSRYKRQLPLLKAKYKKAQMEFNRYKKELPLKEEIPSLLVRLNNIIKSEDVSLMLFRPRPAVPRDLYFVKPIDVNIIATYRSCGAVFEDISRMKRLFKVKNFVIGNPRIVNTHKVLLNVRFNAETYYFKKSNKKKVRKR